jgi:hypothetical protein
VLERAQGGVAPVTGEGLPDCVAEVRGSIHRGSIAEGGGGAWAGAIGSQG